MPTETEKLNKEIERLKKELKKKWAKSLYGGGKAIIL